MIGDNLSSHISEAVICKCAKYHIKFVCLPPNSTHLSQPLDVIKGNFIGYYAAIVAKSYGDEWEINYFKESGKYWVLKKNDLDSREEEDLALVKGYPDERGRFTFE